MTDLNKLDGVFEKIEAPDIKLLREIGKRIGFGRACQILGEQWDDMLEKEWGLSRGRGKMERRNDIEAIEAAIATRAASQTCVAKPELPPLPDGSMACEYVHDAIVFDDADMREYGQECVRAALSASGQTAQDAMPVTGERCKYLAKPGESCRKCGEVHESLEVCTCPSGDGSLRWPCPKHPPVERDPESAEMPQHYSAGDLDSDTFVYKRRDVVAMWKAMQGRFTPYEELVARLRRQVDSLNEKLADRSPAPQPSQVAPAVTAVVKPVIRALSEDEISELYVKNGVTPHCFARAIIEAITLSATVLPAKEQSEQDKLDAERWRFRKAFLADGGAVLWSINGCQYRKAHGVLAGSGENEEEALDQAIAAAARQGGQHG